MPSLASILGYPGQELRFWELGPAPRGLKIPPTPSFEFPRSIKWCHAGAVYLFDSSISCCTENSRIKRGDLVRVSALSATKPSSPQRANPGTACCDQLSCARGALAQRKAGRQPSVRKVTLLNRFGCIPQGSSPSCDGCPLGSTGPWLPDLLRKRLYASSAIKLVTTF